MEKPIETKPLSERYNFEHLKQIVKFIDEGYKLAGINQFSGGQYTTTLQMGVNVKEFRHHMPLDVMLPGKQDQQDAQDYKTKIFKEQLQMLIKNAEK